MRKKSVNGSLTLEFTLLLPVLIMILLLMAQAGLFFTIAAC
ncbi:MAG: pilus assembly protein [Lachnospiraceae bacterium]|nr:pilus assembly protein [Lachnospiraceae bacterium]